MTQAEHFQVGELLEILCLVHQKLQLKKAVTDLRASSQTSRDGDAEDHFRVQDFLFMSPDYLMKPLILQIHQEMEESVQKA